VPQWADRGLDPRQTVGQRLASHDELIRDRIVTLFICTI
jgi:hypothetical protein